MCLSSKDPVSHPQQLGSWPERFLRTLLLLPWGLLHQCLTKGWWSWVPNWCERSLGCFIRVLSEFKKHISVVVTCPKSDYRGREETNKQTEWYGWSGYTSFIVCTSTKRNMFTEGKQSLMSQELHDVFSFQDSSHSSHSPHSEGCCVCFVSSFVCFMGTAVGWC